MNRKMKPYAGVCATLGRLDAAATELQGHRLRANRALGREISLAVEELTFYRRQYVLARYPNGLLTQLERTEGKKRALR
jgi:hypothetical protein